MGTFSSRFAAGRHTTKIPGNGITQSGISAIAQLLHRQHVVLPANWPWVWHVSGKGEYVGTLPKRIGKYARKQGHKLTPEVLSKVGNFGADHCEKSETYNFEFVDKIDWSAGDFGDEGSCFWSCHASAKDILLDNGAGAVCFYHKEFNATTEKRPERGFARAWIIPQPDNCFIVFNGYGIETLPIARILATYFDHAYYRKIDLDNRGCTDGNLWINGGTGYLVGPQNIVQEIAEVSLDWGNPDRILCEHCECEIDEVGHDHDPDGDDLCDDCYSNRVFYCEMCNVNCWIGDNYIDPDGDSICESCYNESIVRCILCEEDFWANDSIESPDRETICPSCHSSKVVKCEECGKEIWKTDSIEGDCVSWCGDCYGMPISEKSAV